MNTTSSDGFDLFVIGTGAAGMAAAIRGAELGRRIAIVEAGTIGGTCVNVGCIPSKNLIAAAERRHTAGKGFPGVGRCDALVDWSRVLDQKGDLIATLRQEKYLDVLDAYPEITLLRGRARLLGKGQVDVDGSRHRAANIVAATGTRPWTPPISGIESVEVLDSTTVMEIAEVPRSMIVLGGSAVGLELGQVFSRLGTRVTVIEMLPRLVATEDEEASAELQRRLEAEGMEIVTGTAVTRIERVDAGVVVRGRTPSGDASVHAERLLVATGRRAVVDGLGLDEARVELDERGFIRTDARMRTSAAAVFAAGDVTGGPGFVYVAAAGGRLAADNALSDGDRELDLRAVPRVTFTDPQMAAVGMTEKEARERGLQVETVRLGLENVPRALVEHRAEGWIKIVAAKETGRILGVHAVAPFAGELLGEATLAVRLGLTTDQLADTFHPYLTWGEGLKLAAQAFRSDVAKLSCCA